MTDQLYTYRLSEQERQDVHNGLYEAIVALEAEAERNALGRDGDAFLARLVALIGRFE